jgi:hypothetical protein
MRPLVYLHEETKRSVNGQVVEDSMINSEYNGKNLHIDERNNNEYKHYSIDNKHLKKLLNKHMSKRNLLDRLKTDYSQKNKKKTARRKHTKYKKRTLRKRK